MTIDTQQTCPMCEEGLLVPFDREETLNIRGGPEISVSLEYSRCSACESELTTPTQTKSNQKRIADARRQKEGLLTGEQIKALREMFSLTQGDASDLFGGGPNAFSKYERGVVTQSVPMDRLMRIAAEVPQVFSVLAKIATQENFRFRINPRVSLCFPDTREDYFSRPVVVSVDKAAKFRNLEKAKQNDTDWVTDTTQEPALRVVNG